MFITKKHLPRRTFLLGTFGAAVAVPFLDAMVPALTAQSRTAAARPLRFGVAYIPNGIFPEYWHPDTTGADFDLKQVMAPLSNLREYITTVSRMKAPDGSMHIGASSPFLNGVGPVGRGGDFSALQSTKTIDQYIADRIAGDTPLRSIEVGTEDMGTSAGACDGYPCAFFNTLAWRDDVSPLPVGVNPRVTFERMFGEVGSTGLRTKNLKEKQSLLDSVLEETASLKQTLGPSDRAVLDEYLSNIREVEGQLARMETRLGEVEATAPLGMPEFFDEHMTITYDLMRIAFQGDISRVFSFLLGHEASSRSYAHIGIPEAHHTVSHHANNPETLAKYAKIGTYQVAKLAEFAEKLRNTPDGDGNLLDNALLYFGSGMSNGNVHERRNPPALLLGHAGGRVKGNNHMAAEVDTPTANLLLGLGEVYGVELKSMGMSTGRILLT
jgi:hypothetical protein